MAAPWTKVRRMPLPDLVYHLGDIDPSRIIREPRPGYAIEDDVEQFDAHQDRLCELIDGVLVEKVYHYGEAVISLRVGTALGQWADEGNHGVVTGASAPFRFGSRQVRMPDAAFTSWDRLPAGIPEEPAPDLVPNVAIEVVNPANTVGEMSRKLIDYFAAGVERVWYIDRLRELVEEYRGSQDAVTLAGDDVLHGGCVLPGFELPVAKIFEKRAPAKKD